MFDVTESSSHLTLMFHAPKAANALGLDDARELARIVKSHASWRRPVVVRSRHQGVFCAGGNLSDHQGFASRAIGVRSNAEIDRILGKFGAWPAPKLAVVEGAAIGGGVEWLARFDLRWATAGASLSFKQKRVGLSFGWGGGSAWAEWIGPARVRQLLLQASTLEANEAYRLGLIDRLVPADGLEEKIDAWARAISSPIDETLVGWTPRREQAIFRALWWAETHRAALARWASKK